MELKMNKQSMIKSAFINNRKCYLFFVYGAVLQIIPKLQYLCHQVGPMLTYAK